VSCLFRSRGLRCRFVSRPCCSSHLPSLFPSRSFSCALLCFFLIVLQSALLVHFLKMSDPFSVASSAVGIISLGLQVTQGVVTYYSQFKAFDGDIAEISCKADGLHGILQALEVPLRKFENRQCSDSCSSSECYLCF